MSYYRITCTSNQDRPVLPDGFSEKVLCNIYDEILQMLFVCPHCGKELLYRWKNYIISGMSRGTSDEAEEAWNSIRNKLIQVSHVDKIDLQIISEAQKVIDSHTCPCCGKELIFTPGYFLVSGVHISDIEGEIFKNRPYRYDSTACLKQYRQESKYSDSKDIYSFNILTEEYFRPKASREYNNVDIGDEMIQFRLIPAEGESQAWGFCTHKISYEEAFELLRHYRKRLYPVNDRVDNLVNIETNIAESEAVTIDKNRYSNTEALKQYLQYAIKIETDYLALRKRLADLYFVQKEMTIIKNNALFNDASDKEILFQAEQNLRNTEEVLKNLQCNHELWKKYIDQFNITKVSYPKEPEEPQQPTLATPGLFNKKKIQAENEEKTAQYNKELTIWRKQHEEWATECVLIKQQNEKIILEAETAAKEKAETELKKAEQAVNEAQEKLLTIKESIDQKKEMKKQKAEEDFWDKDVRETETLLKQCIHAKIQYQESKVIFPKYQDLVAYSTFYEYFETGRCNALSGPDGAYNLYESEIRQNTIISQLSTIIDSLETIKSNQYMVYTQLTKMNESLDRLNNSMDCALNTLEKTLNNIDQNISNISEYTKVSAQNSEVIAYNTAATAYYTKMNADLTNAMGYLVALQ